MRLAMTAMRSCFCSNLPRKAYAKRLKNMATATQNISIRIQVLDGDKTRKELTLTGEQGKLALEKIREATKPASKELVLLNAAGEQAHDVLRELSGEAGRAGQFLSALGPVGLAAAAAVGALTFAVVEGLREYAKFEQSQLRLQAVLKATSNAAGVTKSEIAEFAEAYERATLRGNEEITNAATELLTFKGVSHDTFFEAIKLASDLSVVMGSDLNSVILKFGKILEDPVQNINALSKAGVTFTSQQADMIKSLVETGQESEALAIILEKVKGKVGGTSEGEAGGLTGATHRLRVEWDDLLKAFGANIAESGAVQSSLNFLSNRLAEIQKGVRGTLAEQREAEQKKADTLKGFGNDTLLFGLVDNPFYLEAKKRVAEIDDKIVAEQAEKKKAQADYELGVERDKSEKIEGIHKKLADDLLKSTQTDGDKILAERDRIDKQLSGLATETNKEAIDQARKLNEQLSNTKYDKYLETANRETRQLTEANEKLIESLQKRKVVEGTADPRKKAVQLEVDKLNPTATAEMRDKVTGLAAAIYDESKAAKDATDAQEKHKHAIEEINQGILQTKPSFEVAKEALDDWKEKLIEDLGGATKANEEYVDKIEQIYKVKLKDIYNKAQLDSTKWEDGAARALNRYGDEATNAAKNAERVFGNAATKIEDTLVDMVSTGEFSLKKLGDLVTSIEQDILRSFLRENVTGPIAQGLGSILGGGNSGSSGGSGGGIFGNLFGSLFGSSGGSSASSGGGFFSGIGSFFSGLFHEGGVVGETLASRRAVSPLLFAGAPRFHNGLMPDEFPAILQKGETVLPKGMKSNGMNVTFNISTPNAQSFMESQGQIMAKFAGSLQRHRTRNS
jgi:lambda family phage tail tape measure protein